MRSSTSAMAAGGVLAAAVALGALDTRVAQGFSHAQAGAERGLTAVPGLKVGHHTLEARPTGCTVVIAEAGAVGGVDVRGGAPGTRDTELLNPVNTVTDVHAIVLSGGSAYGLAAA